MKNLLIVLKISLALSLFSALAAPVATVQSVKGNVFGVFEGKTISLVPGSKINSDTHIITEIGSEISMIDFFDRSYNLAGGGHARMLENLVILNRGYIWIQSFQNKQSLQLRSANSKANLSRGGVVFSFDTSSGRSQLLCVDGHVTLSNKIEPDFYTSLATGEFSFIDPEINHGLPRGATKIGYKSYEKIEILFDLKERKQKRSSRTIASVPAVKNDDSSKETMIVPTLQAPSNPTYGNNDFAKSVQFIKRELKGDGAVAKEKKDKSEFEKELLDLYSNKKIVDQPAEVVQKANAVSVPRVRSTNVKVRRFGMKKGASKKARRPASQSFKKKKLPKKTYKRSFKKTPTMNTRTIGERLELKGSRSPASFNSGNSGQNFGKSLKYHLKKQQRHPDEVNSLINELQNYKQDYKKKY